MIIINQLPNDNMNNQEQRFSYDAWGNLRYPRTWVYMIRGH